MERGNCDRKAGLLLEIWANTNKRHNIDQKDKPNEQGQRLNETVLAETDSEDDGELGSSFLAYQLSTQPSKPKKSSNIEEGGSQKAWFGAQCSKQARRA
jgi:hypothetical protein